MKKWLFDPFRYIAGWSALLSGLAFAVITTVVAVFSKAHFDGVIDVHIGKSTPVLTYPAEQLVNWMVLSLVFYAAGVAFSRSTIRFIDVAGTALLARAPLLLSAVVAFGIKLPVTTSIEELSRAINAGFIICSLVSLLAVIWMIALLYKAYTTSCNIKGSKAVVSFIASLIIAETISKILLYFLYQYVL